jgi:hypothetical protein
MDQGSCREVWEVWLAGFKVVAQRQGLRGVFGPGLSVVAAHFMDVFKLFRNSASANQLASQKDPEVCLKWPLVCRPCAEVLITHLWFNCKDVAGSQGKGSWCLIRDPDGKSLIFGHLSAYFHHTGPDGSSQVIGRATWHASNVLSRKEPRVMIPEYDDVLQMPVIKKAELRYSNGLLPLFRCGDWMLPVHVCVVPHYQQAAGKLIVLHQDRCFVQLAKVEPPHHDSNLMREKMGRVDAVKHYM